MVDTIYDGVVLRILVGIWHPAHVHFFKNFIWEMEKKGHEVFVLAREKEITYYLLKTYKIPFIEVSYHRPSITGKIYDFFYRWKKTFTICEKLKPDVALGIGDFYFAQIGKILNFPVIVFTDTEHVKIDPILTFPFATKILTPMCFFKDVGPKQVRYDGYHELAYLHPNYYSPDPSILDLLGVNKNEKYVIMRFVSWAASHDIGHGGLSLEMKRKAVNELSKYAKVYITSEASLPKNMEKYKIRIPPEKIHDALYYATLLYGESATMASECSILGTPAIFLDYMGRGYTDEQEKCYRSIFNFSVSMKDQEKSIDKGTKLLEMPNLKKLWQEKRRKLIEDKIDVTAFMVDFIENDPDSLEKYSS